MKKADRLKRDLHEARTLIVEARNFTDNEAVRDNLGRVHALIVKVSTELIYGIQCEGCPK